MLHVVGDQVREVGMQPERQRLFHDPTTPTSSRPHTLVVIIFAVVCTIVGYEHVNNAMA